MTRFAWRSSAWGAAEDGSPKMALKVFADYTPEMGICERFHFVDHRLEDAVRWRRRLGTRHLRTGLSWSDLNRPGALDWFDRQMATLDEFRMTLIFCFTPDLAGVEPHHTSPPRDLAAYADFCAQMVRRYAPDPRHVAPLVPSSSGRPQRGSALVAGP